MRLTLFNFHKLIYTTIDSTNVVAWHSLGIAYNRKGDHGNAEEALMKARNLDHSQPSILVSLARTYFDAGTKEKALETISQMECQFPNNANAFVSVSKLLGYTSLHSEAEAAVRQALTIDPNLAEAWRTLSISLSNLNRPNESIEAARKFVELQNDAQAWSFLSTSLGKANRYGEAVEAARKAIEIDRNLASAWKTLSMNLVESEKPDEAIDAALRAVQITEKADEWSNLSLVYRKTKHRDDAIRAALKAVDTDPRSANAWRSLSLCVKSKEDGINAQMKVAELTNKAEEWIILSEAYTKAKRRDEAVSAAKRATKLRPDLPDAWRSLSLSLTALGKAGEAIDAQNRVASLTANAVDWYHLGVACGTARRHEDAVAAAEKAIEIDPNLAAAWQCLSINLSCLGKADEAIKAQEKVAGLTSRAEDWFHLSVAYGNARRHEEAVESARKATQIDPSFEGGWNSMAINLVKLGRVEESLDVQEKFAEIQKSSETWCKLSLKENKMGFHSRAAQSAQKAIDLNQSFAKAWHALAESLDELGKINDATSAWRKILQLSGELNSDLRFEEDITNSHAWKRFVERARGLGQIRKAISFAESQLKEIGIPCRPLVPFVEHCIKVSPGEVLSLIKQMVARDPSNPQFLFLLSVCQRKAGDLNGALKSSLDTIAISSDHYENWYTLGLIYEGLGQSRSARDAFTHALALNPNHRKSKEHLSHLG